MAITPECPECGADHEAAPDAFGVCSCSECGVSFRPPGRVPIRRAGSSQTEPQSNKLSWIAAAAIGIGAAVAIILGDSQAPPEPPPFELQPIQFEVPVFDPNTLEPFGPVALAHEVHLSRVVDGRLQASGLVRNAEARELRSPTLELRFIDVAGPGGAERAMKTGPGGAERAMKTGPGGAERAMKTGTNVGNHAATLACRKIAAQRTCAWAVDAPIPAGMVEFELDAWAHPDLMGDVFASFDLHRTFDAAGHPLESGDALELDVQARTVRVRVPEDLRVFDAWATLTCFADDSRVLDVIETRWTESLVGAAILPITLPQHLPSRFELRVGGTAMPSDLVLPIPPP